MPFFRRGSGDVLGVAGLRMGHERPKKGQEGRDMSPLELAGYFGTFSNDRPIHLVHWK